MASSRSGHVAKAGGGGSSILLVEDDWIVARDVQALLQQQGYDVVGIAKDGDRALELARIRPIDLALVDIGLGADDGTEVASNMNREVEARIVFVTARADEATIARAAKVGACGYLLKPFTDAQLVAAVRHALARPSLAPAADAYRQAVSRIATALAELGIVQPSAGLPTSVRPVPGLSRLSTREWEVLRALLAGQRVPTIAKRLFISPATVRNHLKSIFTKLDVHSQEELLEMLTRATN